VKIGATLVSLNRKERKHDYPAKSANWRKLATLRAWKLAASTPPPTAFPSKGVSDGLAPCSEGGHRVSQRHGAFQSGIL